MHSTIYLRFTLPRVLSPDLTVHWFIPLLPEELGEWVPPVNNLTIYNMASRSTWWPSKLLFHMFPGSPYTCTCRLIVPVHLFSYNLYSFFAPHPYLNNIVHFPFNVSLCARMPSGVPFTIMWLWAGYIHVDGSLSIVPLLFTLALVLQLCYASDVAPYNHRWFYM